MKKFWIILLLGLTGTGLLHSQTVSDFENLSLPADTFWDGSDLSGGFSSGNAFFPNTYQVDTVYGGYWSQGFAASTMTDSATAGFGNMYSARSGSGFNGSITYAVGQQNAVIRLTGNAAGKVVNGFYITNSTYAALSMKNGDAFSKKFGGTSGNDPDWFKLSIIAWDECCQVNDTVHFYLADYRFADNGQDYIVNDWQWVSLGSLGNIDSLRFILTSSDTGMFGMNTPPFFCIDNFSTADSYAGTTENDTQETFLLYPNPAGEYMYFELSADINHNVYEIFIFDISGRITSHEFIEGGVYKINTAGMPAGQYCAAVVLNNQMVTKTFVKIP